MEYQNASQNKNMLLTDSLKYFPSVMGAIRPYFQPLTLSEETRSNAHHLPSKYSIFTTI